MIGALVHLAQSHTSLTRLDRFVAWFCLLVCVLFKTLSAFPFDWGWISLAHFLPSASLSPSSSPFFFASFPPPSFYTFLAAFAARCNIIFVCLDLLLYVMCLNVGLQTRLLTREPVLRRVAVKQRFVAHFSILSLCYFFSFFCFPFRMCMSWYGVRIIVFCSLNFFFSFLLSVYSCALLCSCRRSHPHVHVLLDFCFANA